MDQLAKNTKPDIIDNIVRTYDENKHDSTCNWYNMHIKLVHKLAQQKKTDDTQYGGMHERQYYQPKA